MLLHEIYTAPAIIDGRAHRRDTFAPSTISVRAMGAGSIAQHVNAAVGSTPIPCAYVTSSGDVWILTGGGSGVIAFAGDDPTLDQSDRIALLVDALESLGGVVESLDDPEPVRPKRKNRKQVDIEPAVEDAAASEESWVAWTVNEEGEPF